MDQLQIAMLLIGLEVIGVAHEKPDLPDPCRLIDHITDDDRREGIRRYFADVESIEGETLEKILVVYKGWEAEQEQMRGIADMLVGVVMGGAG